MYDSWEENLTIGIGRFPDRIRDLREISEQRTFMGVKFLDKKEIFVTKKEVWKWDFETWRKVSKKSWEKEDWSQGWIFAQWSTNIGILEKEKEFKKKWFKMILRNEQWLKNFWEKGKFVVGRKLERGNYGIHNVNFSIIFVAIWTQ